MPGALKGISQLFVAFDKVERPIAFMGLDGKKIEMLFVALDKLRQGIGKELMKIALQKYGCDNVCVNEQNPDATAFYQKMGFAVVKRSELDEQGNPYPILYMQYMKNEG